MAANAGLLNSLKNELTKSVNEHNSRKERKEKLYRVNSTSSELSSLIYDVQGLNIKRVWEKVLGSEVNDKGRNIWIDMSTVITQSREHQKNLCKYNNLKIDFTIGPGGGVDAIVKRFDKKYQRYYGNKRRQYHQLCKIQNPPILPETHFSIHSAIRSASSSSSNKIEDLWFIKAPGVQRGEGIIVQQGHSLNSLLFQNDKDSGAGKYLKNNKQWEKLVIQRSVSHGNIACINGCKADLRMYILCAPDGKIYYFPNAIVRIAQATYEGNHNISFESQLTNVSTGGHIIQGTEWELFCKSLPLISKLLKRLVTSSIDWFQHGRCELIGVDIMLDIDGNPFLLELNNSPQMGGYDTPYLFREVMLKQMLHLAIYPSLRTYYAKNKNDMLASLIPPKMPLDQIEWILLYDMTIKSTNGSNDDNNSNMDLKSEMMFPIRFTWLVDELVYLEKIIDYLTKEDEANRNAGLNDYFHLLLKYKKEWHSIDDNHKYMVKPKVKFDKLGCIGIIIHPSLPNEEVVCIGYKQQCWLLKKKVTVINTMVLKNDDRELQKIDIEKKMFKFIEKKKKTIYSVAV